MTDTPRLVVGPFNRVEGDLEVHIEVNDGMVASARVNAPLYRGFERMLEGKDPRDALTITPRICGICSISQSVAAARALGAAMGISPTPQGGAMAALIHAVENVSDHLTHFNLFFMPDFARPVYAGRSWHGRAVERFTAIEGSAVRQSVEARAKLMHILGLMAGKWPHTLAIQPGGVTRAPGPRDKIRIETSLRAFRGYLERVLFGAPLEEFIALETPEALVRWGRGDIGLFLEIAQDLSLESLGAGSGRYMSFGAYPLENGHGFASGIWEGGIAPLQTTGITEDLSHAWMLGETAHPMVGMTRPDEVMRDAAYSWCKAPRLDGRPIEVGALARQIIDGHPLARSFDGAGVLGRVAGRLLEIARTQLFMEQIARDIDPAARYMVQGKLPEHGQGVGLVEAARGALGHWVRIERGRIASYQIIAPTTWNFSPRDAQGTPGPLEAALVGAPVGQGETSPISVQHIVRSFDPCMVCTVH
ncbi:nickel-dependent hydrogenase large subunit [Sinirhodobacter sp. WL0062]|uniref:Nickel-dependent hydrogenase large subunit n=1 Tax=Rhodobacter flavimaris TaxID=2907145 RepID=A0ABS8YSD7_9RHOB|nr:nickel-dependent hydrogenase large subunit [Sinirhodobacter sp. WL0062]MCE5972368.1 nickel-dependent hydrogenase large subunit [Sinirhodobacter sp. WL0062]